MPKRPLSSKTLSFLNELGWVPWTEEDEDWLRYAYRDPGQSIDDIAAHLNRSRNAVIQRAKLLGVRRPNVSEDKYRQEIALVSEMVLMGMTLHAIARSLKRIPPEIAWIVRKRVPARVKMLYFWKHGKPVSIARRLIRQEVARKARGDQRRDRRTKKWRSPAYPDRQEVVRKQRAEYRKALEREHRAAVRRRAKEKENAARAAERAKAAAKEKKRIERLTTIEV